MESATLKYWCVLAFVSLAVGFATPLVPAQAPPSGESAQVPADGGDQSPLCGPDVIDATFAFRNEPAGEQTVSLYFLNKGNAACRLKEPPNPSFSVDGHSMYVGSCPFCGPDGKPLPMWNRRPENQVVLAPGETAAIDVNWTSTGESCQWADWATFFFNWTEVYDPRKLTQFLFSPSGWPLHICSPVRSFGYRTAADSPSAGGEKDPALRVSLLEKTVYSDERATLHVVLAKPPQASEKPVGCASLYTVSHTPSQTRLDPLHTAGSSRVDSYTPEQIREDRERAWPEWKHDFKGECSIASGRTSADAEVQASVLATVTHIEWRTAPAPGTGPAFLSVATHFEVLDVDSLPSNWGESVKGIRAGLSVDRERFIVGDRVPLHLRWENVSASDSLGEGECHEPEPDVEIQDSQHHVLKTTPGSWDCMGSHGFGAFGIAKGKPQHHFREFTTASDPVPPFVTPTPPTLPGPGVYFLVSVWSARVLEIDAEASPHRRIGGGKFGAVYATARSTPVRIEVVPRGNP